MTYEEAREVCRHRNGRLPVFNSKAEESIARYQSMEGVPSLSWEEGAWLDLMPSNDTKKFLSVRDSRALTYTNWEPGQPDNAGQNCVTFFSQGRGWHDIGCSDKSYVVCQF